MAKKFPKYQKINLISSLTMLLLKKKFQNIPIGYSDHTINNDCCIAAIGLGANLIEKHFTYNKNQKVGDHKFSLSPKELKVMIQNIKLAEASMGLNKRLISKKRLWQ